MEYFQKEIEIISEKELKKIQIERLKKIFNFAKEKIPFYKKLYEKTGIKKIDSLSDLKNLPFTKKTDLRDNYPFKMFSCDLKEVLEIHASSGTTGKLTVVGYTRNDIEVWSEVMARSLACAGVRKGDIIQNAYGYGLFTGGLGVHYGALKLGVTVIPISAGGTQRQLMIIQDFKSTVLTCTPSYSLYMAEEAKEMGIDPRKTTIRVGILGAEPWTEGMRRQIEKEWDMIALDIYGLSEIIGPGVAVECEGKEGLHVWADHFLPEVIDPETGEVLEEGKEGELVLTTLTKEALPMIRYRTGDIVKIINSVCPNCKRTMPRISKIKGRIDDMLIIRGINVFPSQIETVLTKSPEVAPHYQIIVTREKHLDKLEVRVEITEKTFSDEIKKLEELQKKVEREISGVLGLSVSVKLVEPKSIERSMGKAKRVIDLRKELKEGG
ncbi:MAG: phenylacetate--CoA ligase [bacterium]|nr:phenylacetate--CoA ligase [bacterium]MDW8163938.1 phenylacetate--CoA ligase [Candidatus Omnitrophota bacterium]